MEPRSRWRRVSPLAARAPARSIASPSSGPAPWRPPLSGHSIRVGPPTSMQRMWGVMVDLRLGCLAVTSACRNSMHSKPERWAARWRSGLSKLARPAIRARRRLEAMGSAGPESPADRAWVKSWVLGCGSAPFPAVLCRYKLGNDRSDLSKKPLFSQGLMVGAPRFELGTPSPPEQVSMDLSVSIRCCFPVPLSWRGEKRGKSMQRRRRAARPPWPDLDGASRYASRTGSAKASS